MSRSERAARRRAWSGRAVRVVGAGVVALTLACGDDSVVPEVASEPEALRLHAPVARVETTHRWLDLLAQRPSAVVMRDEVVTIDLAHRSANKHLALGQDDQWTLGVEIDERVAGLVRGRTVSFDVPIDGELSPALNPDTEEHAGLALALTLRPMVEKQSVTVLWEEDAAGPPAPGTEGWQRRTLSLPAEQDPRRATTGMRLHFRRVGEHAGRAGGRGGDAAWRWGVTSGSPACLPRPSTVAAVPPSLPDPSEGERHPRAGWPGTGPGLLPGAAAARAAADWTCAGQGSLQVLASSDADHREGRPPTVLFEEPLRPAGDRRELDLTAWGGVPTRLEIRARGSKGVSGAVLRDGRADRRAPLPAAAIERPRAPA